MSRLSIKTIRDLEKIYGFRNKTAIINYLNSNLDLVPVLEQAYSYINKIFGDVPIYLELHKDPEEDWYELFIVINTALAPEDAIKLESRLFDEWFVNIISKVGNRLCFTEEPILWQNKHETYFIDD